MARLIRPSSRHDRRRAPVRRDQRLPRCRELDRDDRVDPRAVAAPRGAVGDGVQLRRTVYLSAGRRQYDLEDHQDPARRPAFVWVVIVRPVRRDPVEPVDVVVGPALVELARADRWPVGRGASPTAGASVLDKANLYKTLYFIILAPLIGLILGGLMMFGSTGCSGGCGRANRQGLPARRSSCRRRRTRSATAATTRRRRSA